MDQDQGVGREVKRLREAKDWSQTRLATEAGMSVSGISMIENGHRNLSTATLAKLAEALGVGVRDLFPLEQAPLPDFEDERRAEQRVARWREAMVFAQRFARLNENLSAIRDRMDEYREAWEARLAEGNFDKAALDEGGRALRTFWPAVVTAAEAEIAELERIGTPPEEIAENSVLQPAMERFQALCDRVNRTYREKFPNGTAPNVYPFPHRKAS